MENSVPRLHSTRKNETGNVLFLILIAVALFAALSYAVTQSTRSGGPSAAREKASTKAARFAQYGAAISMAIQRIRVSNGCSEDEINFDNPIQQHPDFWGGSANPRSPADGRCNVFGANGGGMYYWDATKEFTYKTPDFSYIAFSGLVSVLNVGTPASELIMYFVLENSEESTEICNAYNRDLGLTGNTGAGTTRTLDWMYFSDIFAEYKPNQTAGMQIGEDPDPSAFKGQLTGCLNGNSSHDADSKILYYVLIPR